MADHFVGVRFASDKVRAGPFRRAASGEAGNGEIETAPEKMHRAALPDEPRSELLEHSVRLNQDSPESVGVLGVVRLVLRVFSKRNRVGNLVRLGVDFDFDPERSQHCHKLGIELGNRARRKNKRPDTAFAGPDDQRVVDEVEVDLEGPIAIRNRRGRKPARRNVQRGVPEVINRRAQRESNLADNLALHMKRRISVFPLLQGQAWPRFGA